MAVQYFYIRVDRELTVPATSVFNDTGDVVNILCPGFDKPFACGGEIGDGIRLFLTGARSFKVTPNGVLDLYGSLVDNLQAQQAFNYTPPARPQDDLTSVILDANQFKDYNSGPKPPATPPGIIDVDAVARAIKNRPK
jgi:hypothetical protein